MYTEREKFEDPTYTCCQQATRSRLRSSSDPVSDYGLRETRTIAAPLDSVDVSDNAPVNAPFDVSGSASEDDSSDKSSTMTTQQSGLDTESGISFSASSSKKHGRQGQTLGGVSGGVSGGGAATETEECHTDACDGRDGLGQDDQWYVIRTIHICMRDCLLTCLLAFFTSTF